MPKLVARCIAISLDGFSAAKGQALDAPFGKDGLRLMEWAFVTKFFAQMTGQDGGAEGLDNEFLIHSFDNIGATIMGRNMFGPQRGPWPNEDWKGWWGPNPPYHHPVFVLSHHEHSSFEMEGGTSSVSYTHLRCEIAQVVRGVAAGAIPQRDPGASSRCLQSPFQDSGEAHALHLSLIHI